MGPGLHDCWKEPEGAETTETSQKLKQERILLWLSQVECSDVDPRPNDNVSLVPSSSVVDLKILLVVLLAVVALTEM